MNGLMLHALPDMLTQTMLRTRASRLCSSWHTLSDSSVLACAVLQGQVSHVHLEHKEGRGLPLL